MYERFTDRARKVMQLANQEAKRFNHEYIGTEHILLGLIKEGTGTATNVLKNLDIDLRKVRLEVEKIIQPGPDIVTLGKLPQTPKARRVIEYAVEEARNLNHNYVGTEHLLLGLSREGEGVAAQVLANLGLKLEDIREEVLSLLGQNTAKQKCPACGRPMRERMGKRGAFLGCSGYPDCKTTMSFGPDGQPVLSAVPTEHICEKCGQQMVIRQGKRGPFLVCTGYPKCKNAKDVDADLARRDVPSISERERIRSLEQQLWNVRIVLGALTGALAGALLAAQLGGVLGLILGGVVAAIGWRIPAALAGAITGARLGAAHLPSEGGGLTGALLGALAGILIAEIGAPSDHRGFSKLWRRK